MQNPDAVNNIIDHLASKLSIPAAQLWQVLIKQTYIDGIFSCLMVILSAAIIYGCYKWSKKFDWRSDPDDIIPTMFIVTVSAITFVFGVTQFYNMLVNFVNPQYAALQELMNMIVKK